MSAYNAGDIVRFKCYGENVTVVLLQTDFYAMTAFPIKDGVLEPRRWTDESFFDSECLDHEELCELLDIDYDTEFDKLTFKLVTSLGGG